jgi:hypothetical protein
MTSDLVRGFNVTISRSDITLILVDVKMYREPLLVVLFPVRFGLLLTFGEGSRDDSFAVR